MTYLEWDAIPHCNGSYRKGKTLGAIILFKNYFHKKLVCHFHRNTIYLPWAIENTRTKLIVSGVGLMTGTRAARVVTAACNDLFLSTKHH